LTQGAAWHVEGASWICNDIHIAVIAASKEFNMKRMQALLKEWDSLVQDMPIMNTIAVNLSARDYARIRALAELFKGRNEAQLVTELLTAALDEVEEALPYVQGKTVIAEDELGDPIYEDVGMTHKFEQLTKKHLAAIK
jgi:hypothetical protein